MKELKLGNHAVNTSCSFFPVWLQKTLRMLSAMCLPAAFVCSLHATADVTDPPVTTTDESAPVYYLIQNWDSKEYYMNDGSSNALWSTEGVTNVTSGTSKHDVDDYLFYFVASGEGYLIGSKTAGAGKYLNETQLYYSTLRGSASAALSSETGFKAEGTTWYIEKCQYNNVGVEIKDANGKYWQKSHPGGHTSYWAIGLEDTADDNKQVWILWSFDDLVAEAQAHGVTGIDYENLDASQGSSFKTLVDAIKAKQTSSYVSDYQSNFTSGNYLIRSRQYGTFLNTNGTAMSGTTAPTQYSVWNVSLYSGELTITGCDEKVIYTKDSGTTNVTWNIGADGSVWHPAFAASSDNNNRYISFTANGTNNNPRYFGMGKTATETKTDIRPSIDWELIPVAADNTYTIDGQTYTVAESITAEDDIVAEDLASGSFFRIANVARQVEASEHDQFYGGGWLEDVDHTHFTNRKQETPVTAHQFDQTEADRMYGARTVDFYAALPNMSHANALWQFELIGHGSGGGENATGLISPEHNIYALRNANTGKYVGNNVITEAETQFFQTATNKNDAAKFYLEKVFDGQYLMWLYGGTDFSSATDSPEGTFAISGTTDGYHAGLAKAATAQRNTATAWIIMPAPTLHLPVLLAGVSEETGKNYHLYDWTTFYYPFDVQISDDNPSSLQATIYQGAWAGTYLYDSGKQGGSVQMNPVDDVPAGQAVFVGCAPGTGTIVLNVYPAGSGHTATPSDAFDGNVWKGIAESEEKELFGANGWRDYWILSKNKNSLMKLLHPAGNYLLPNRAYIDAETVATLTNAKISAFDLMIDETTGIKTVYGNDNFQLSTFNSQLSPVYDLQGRKVEMLNVERLNKQMGQNRSTFQPFNLSTLNPGIYIIGKKKIIIK